VKIRKENDIRDDFYVYYLQLQRDSDESYIQLAASMRNLGVTLIPVKCHDLDHYILGESIPLIVMTDTIEKQKQFQRFRKSYLDFALRSQKVTLFHLNSFARISSLYEQERKGLYHQMMLPIRTSDVAEKIITFYFKQISNEKVWPGGRRVTLESMKGRKE